MGRLSERVVVDIRHVEGGLAHYRTEELLSFLNPGVPRPASGAIDGEIACLICGDEFVYQIWSVPDTRRRRRRYLYLTGIAVACLVAVVAVVIPWTANFDSALPALLAALVGAALLAATAVCAVGIADDGVTGPARKTRDGLRRRGHRHYLSVQPGHSR